MRVMIGTAITVTLLAGAVVGAHAQTGGGSSSTPNTSATSAQAGAANSGAASDAAKARVGAVRGVTEEVPKPAAGATGPDAAGAVQGAGAVK